MEILKTVLDYKLSNCKKKQKCVKNTELFKMMKIENEIKTIHFF